jgi:general L-amino acid transport system permease protein
VGRFAGNALVRGLCRVYVEAFRNIPLLLQLLMWYLFFTEVLPEAAQAWQLGPLFLSKGGLNFPIPVWALGHELAALGLLVGVGRLGRSGLWAPRGEFQHLNRPQEQSGCQFTPKQDHFPRYPQVRRMVLHR